MIGAANRIHSQRSRGLRPELDVLNAVPGSSGTFTAPCGIGRNGLATVRPTGSATLRDSQSRAKSAAVDHGPLCR